MFINNTIDYLILSKYFKRQVKRLGALYQNSDIRGIEETFKNLNNQDNSLQSQCCQFLFALCLQFVCLIFFQVH